MPSQNIMNIVIKAQDMTSSVAKKVENSFNQLGNSINQSFNTNAASNLNQQLTSMGTKIDSITNHLKTVGTNGQNSFNQLTQAEQKTLIKLSELDPVSAGILTSLTQIGFSGQNSFNQLSVAEKNALINMKSAKQQTEELNQSLSVVGIGAAEAANKLAQIKLDPSVGSSMDRAKLKVSEMGISLETVKGKILVLGNTIQNSLSTKWDTTKSKVNNLAITIKSKLGSALSSVRSKIDSVASAFSGMGGIISSAIGGLGMASIGDLTIGLAMTREQMTNLTTATMGSASAAKSFVAYMDNLTNNSLVSLNDLGQAMSTIKMSTGMTNSELKSFSNVVNDIGQRAILMGKDSSEAMSIMQAAGRGLNGEFDILKTNFGITKKQLEDAGWSGAADDVKGYQNALEKCLEAGGSMDGMMNTTTGLLKQVEKGFTSAGRQIGEQFTPYIRQALQFMVGIKKSNPEVYKGLIMIAGGISGFATIAPTLSPIISAFDGIVRYAKSAGNGIKRFLQFMTILKAEEGAFTIMNIAKAFSSFNKTLKETRSVTLALKSANEALAISEYLTLGPILLVVAALAILAVGIFEVGKSFGWWTDVGSMLEAISSGLQRVWSAFINHPDVQGTIKAITEGWNWLMEVLNPVITILQKVWTAMFGNGTGDIVTDTINGIGNAWNVLKSIMINITDPVKLIASLFAVTIVGAMLITQTVITELTNALNWLINQISNLTNSITGGLVEAFNWLNDGINSLLSLIGGALTNTFSTLIETTDIIVETFTSLWEQLSSGTFLLDSINSVFSYFNDILIAVGNFIPDEFLPVWQILSEIFTTVWSTVLQLVVAFQNLLNGQMSLGEYIRGVWSIIFTFISTVLNLLVQLVIAWGISMVNYARNTSVKFLTSVVTFFSQLPKRVWQYLSNVIQRIGTWSSTIVSKGRSAGSRFLNGVITYIRQLPNRVATYITSTTHKIVTGATAWVSNARSKALGVVNAVKGQIANLPNIVYNEFINIGSRMMSAGSTLVSKARAIGRNIVNGLLNAMKIHSPGEIQTKVVLEFENTLKRVGNMTGDGLKVGSAVGNSIVNGFNDFDLNAPVLDRNNYSDIEMDRISADEITEIKSDIGTGESVDVSNELLVNGEIRIKHDFINLPDSVSADDVARIVEESTTNDEFISKLVNSRLFQNLDFKAKSKLQAKLNRNRGIL